VYYDCNLTVGRTSDRNSLNASFEPDATLEFDGVTYNFADLTPVSQDLAIEINSSDLLIRQAELHLRLLVKARDLLVEELKRNLND